MPGNHLSAITGGHGSGHRYLICLPRHCHATYNLLFEQKFLINHLHYILATGCAAVTRRAKPLAGHRLVHKTELASQAILEESAVLGKDSSVVKELPTAVDRYNSSAMSGDK